MLYKSEIAAVPYYEGKVPKTGYSGYGRRVTLTKTGPVYVYDLYKDGKFDRRYCVDGESYIAMDSTGRFGDWVFRSSIWWDNVADIGKTKKESDSFFLDGNRSDIALDRYIEDIRLKRRQHKGIRQLNKMEKCIAMFPARSRKFEKWCDEELFGNYIFISNSVKKVRKATCDGCGAEFETTDAKHKEECVCPVCGRKSIWYLERYKKSIKIKKKVNSFYIIPDFKLYLWTRCELSYSSGKRKIAYEDYYYTGKCESNTAASFRYGEGIFDRGIKKKDWDTPDNNEWYIYPENIKEMFGEGVLKYIDPENKFNLFTMVRNLIDYPQTEYLLKAGLVKLAHKVQFLNTDESKIEKVLGVEKKYVPMCIKHNVNCEQLSILKEISRKEHITEEVFLFYKGAGVYIPGYTSYFPAGASYSKIARYCKKQRGGYCAIATRYCDYKNMAKELGVELKKKYDIWPVNLRQEHDRLAEKVNAVRNAEKEKEFKKKIKKIHKQLPTEFHDDNYCVVLPDSVEAFSKEGANLKICVGSMSYYLKHMNGQSVICFIRHIDEPDKSYVCCEIDDKAYKIMQIHGYKNDMDKKLPAEVKKFAEKYIKEIKKFRNRKGA